MKNIEPKKTASTVTGMLIGAGVILVILGLVSLGIAGARVYKNRTALRFAMDKPEIVNSIMKQYNEKQKQIDADFLKTKETATDQLLKVITEEIKK